MKPYFIAGIFISALFLSSFLQPSSPTWGFFGHRRINRMAAFTLPPEMMCFFKPHIDWLSDHAVDADMRRYATPFEAPRHYIDLDNYDPIDSLPTQWSSALMRHTFIFGVEGRDTVLFISPNTPRNWPDSLQRRFQAFFRHNIVFKIPGNDFSIHADSLSIFLPKTKGINFFFEENLTKHGIVPWHLQRLQRDLTSAFRQKQGRRILRLCADMGHYIADAHVPLHTTSNYNGQKTGQHGIHAFWESRVPELFAEDTYDFFVGKPEYIAFPEKYFWKIVLDSYAMVDSVLSLEKQLRENTPADRQFCPEQRNGRMVAAACPEYAAEYQRSLNGMIERRMRASIHAVASAWYTAWMDAGQPDLTSMEALYSPEEVASDSIIRQIFNTGRILGREEGF